MKERLIFAFLIIILFASAVYADGVTTTPALTTTNTMTATSSNVTNTSLMIKSIKTTAISISSANVIWYTDRTSDTCIRYWIDEKNVTTKCSNDYASSTYHLFNVKNLLSNTTYNFEIVSKNKYGTEIRQTGAFTTLPVTTGTVTITQTQSAPTTTVTTSATSSGITAATTVTTTPTIVTPTVPVQTTPTTSATSGGVSAATTVPVMNQTNTTNIVKPVLVTIQDASTIVIPSGAVMTVSKPYRVTPLPKKTTTKLNVTINGTK